MLQSTHGDPVLGLDLHLVAVPAPPTLVALQVPMPFVGLVFDPAGLAVGIAINLLFSGGPGVVMVNGLPATNCGTSVTNGLTLPHPAVPGIAFLTNGLPVKVGDAELFFGSNQVSLGGSFGVRFGEQALSCSDPVRLPTSFVIAIPKGLPVLNMASSVLDAAAVLQTVLMHGARALLGRLFHAVGHAADSLFRHLRSESQFWRALSEALGGCHAPSSASRIRQAVARAVRTVTGHPIDLVTGNLFTDVIDVALPGPLPLVIERVYESCASARAGVLGHGWSHTLDEALWFERGRAIYRAGDGRALEFELFDLADRTLRPGNAVERVPDRIVLRCTGAGRYEVEQEDGTVHELAHVHGGDPSVARLVRIRSEDRHHDIELAYDEAGRLAQVRESGGRILRFEHDALGRLTCLKLPVPHGRGWYAHRRYAFDAEGDLVSVVDAAGERYRYVYRQHLLVQETDRTGASFYFQYDGAGQSARCVRTWGDGGIYDHVVEYDVKNRRTLVRDSLGAPRLCEYDAFGLVTRMVDGEGRVTTIENDPITRAERVVIAADGTRTERAYDAHGNLVAITTPEGSASMTYEGRKPVRMVDDRGRCWSWRYDTLGHLACAEAPGGRRSQLGWQHGLLTSIDEDGDRVHFEYDAQREVASTRTGAGELIASYAYDGLGRAHTARSGGGGVLRIERDAEGRVVASSSLAGVTARARYDAEGHLIEHADATRHQRFTYGPGHRLATREEAGTTLRFEHDTECRLVAVVNEAGERYAFTLDRVGEMREELAFDGARRQVLRDRRGHVQLAVRPSSAVTKQEHDDAGRLARVTHADGTFVAFRYDTDGELLAVENESCRVELGRDEAGAIVSERCVQGEASDEVVSAYAAGRRVELRTSLGGRVAYLDDLARHTSQVFFGLEPTPAVTIERDALGRERIRRFANGVDLAWQHDEAGRPTVRRTLARLTGLAGLEAAAAVLADPSRRVAAPKRELARCEYAWRGDDQIASMADSAFGPRHFDHDARGRLVRETRGRDATERAADAVGNLYRAVDRTDRRYGPGARLLERDGARFEHDAEGNPVRRVDASGEAWRFAWNGHGLLREVTRPDGSRVAFAYDAFARRIGKRLLASDGRVERETRFVWDGATVVHEIDSRDGLTTWHWSPDGEHLLARERGGRIYAITTDHLGTPTEMYDERGELVWQMRLDVWGLAELSVGERADCPWRWPGQYEDAETGLYYNRHRYYSPEDGRYLSQDPLRLEGGLALYGYVEDPTSWIDPLGLNARRLRAAMEQMRNQVIGPEWSPHHIVEENRPGIAAYSRELLARQSVSVDDGRNGARLYGTHPAQVARPAHPGRHAARAAGTYHAGRHIHGEAADRLIYRILAAGERRGIPAVQLLDDISRRMEAGHWRDSFEACGG